MLAARWALENITAFGGDALNAPLTGERPGGHELQYLELSPEAAARMIQRALLQSVPMSSRSTTAARNSANQHVEWLIRLLEDRKTPDAPISADQARQMREEMEAAGTLGEYLRAAQGHDLYQAVVNYSSL